MKVIEQSAKILPERDDILKQIEERGRVCYQSQDKITDGSAKKFVDDKIKRKHNSVLEMAVICLSYPIENPTNYMSVVNGTTSASVRAWREYIIDNPGRAALALKSKYPLLFGTLLTDGESPVHSPFIEMPTNDLDHTYVCVQFITNRVVTHEMVRHRPCSFLQESQRYVRYDSEDGIEFVRPVQYDNWATLQQVRFLNTCKQAEDYYRVNLREEMPAQEARNNLPNSTKTEILVYCNLRQWNHMFFMRAQGGADPQIKALMKPLLAEFRDKFPGNFDELQTKVE